jgi:hypothetical protein
MSRYLKQLMVLSPSGPCFANRPYDINSSNVDPQLLSATLASFLSQGDKVDFALLKKILKSELGMDEMDIKIDQSYNFVTAAITNGETGWPVVNMLRKVSQLCYETLGNSKSLHSIDNTTIDRIEKNIDIMLCREGYI